MRAVVAVMRASTMFASNAGELASCPTGSSAASSPCTVGDSHAATSSAVSVKVDAAPHHAAGITTPSASPNPSAAHTLPVLALALLSPTAPHAFMRTVKASPQGPGDRKPPVLFVLSVPLVCKPPVPAVLSLPLVSSVLLVLLVFSVLALP